MTTIDATTHTDVLIAGAGPTGLVLAIDLARRGIRHRLVDRADRGFPGSRGAGLQPRSLEVFEDLGVLGAMRAAGGGPCPPLMLWDGDRQTGEWDMFDRAEPTPAVPYGEIMMLPQWRTVEILAARHEELGGHVDFGTELTGFEQDEDGVTATLTGPDGTTETVRARYLVGADGGRSSVRRALGVGFAGEPVDERVSLLADVVVDGLERTHWHVWPEAPGGRLMLRPLEGAETFQLVARYEDPDAQPDPERDGTTEALQRLIEERTGRSDLKAGEVHWTSAFRPRMAMAERFRSGRVFLAGDAAHVHSPAGGQGLNTSIQDAYNLGWKLDAVLRRGAPDSFLDTYATERMGVAADVLGLSTRIHHEDDGGQPRRGPETLQLHVGYPDSPLTRELRRDLPEGALRAGYRAPDAPCEDPASGARVRLFDVFQGPHATVLALGDSEPAAVPEWARVFRPVDVDGHVKEAYGSGYFVIRPDGYVGLATDDAEDVGAYLATLTG